MQLPRQFAHWFAWSLAAASAVLAAPAPAVTPAPDSARLVIEQFNAALIDVMRRGPQLGFSGRAEALRDTLLSAYDIPYVARLTLGRAGRSLSDAQHEAFAIAFADMVIATYASRFDNLGDRRLRIKGERALKRGRHLVETVLEKPAGSAVRLNYVLQQTDHVWRIVNVIAEGVSDLSLKRAEYRSVIQREGFESLLARLREQTRRLVARQ